MNDITIFDTDHELEKLSTDSDYEDLFIKVAKHHKVSKFSELQEKVASMFEEKLDERLARWGHKLELDRTLLKEVFDNA